ncbi:MAG: hypothetical protein ABR970_10850 [Roseiarcus sp.]
MLIPGQYTDIASIIHNQTPMQFGTGPDGAIHYSILVDDPAYEGGRWNDSLALTFSSVCRVVGSDAIVPFPTDSRPVAAPPQVVSDGKYVYVFRAFTDAIYVDRFVPDVVNAVLNPTYDVRKREDGTYGYTDLNGNPYFEPAVCLEMLRDAAGGAFAVLQVPTSRPGVNRWQFFLLRANGAIRNVSIRCSADGLFDLKEQTISYALPADQGKRQKVQTLELPGVTDAAFAPAGLVIRSGLSAARFLKHDQVTLASGQSQPLRTYVHVLLAFAADVASGIGVLDFEVGKDGTLATAPARVTLPTLAGPSWTMSPQPADRRGLVVSTGLLTFVQSADTPFILDSGDGFVHLYLRGLDSQYLVAFYDTLDGLWVNRENPLASQVMNTGEWLADGYKTAIDDSELLLLGSDGGYVIWQYDPIVTGFRDGARQANQGFPGRAVVSGAHSDLLDRRIAGALAIPALLVRLGQGRMLFLNQTGGYEVWQYDSTVPAGYRDGLAGQDFPGKAVLVGVNATFFGDGPGRPTGAPAFAACLDQNRILFLDADGSYAVWAFDTSAAGFRDGRAGQNFPGAIVVSGDGPGFFQNRQSGGGPPASVTYLGQNRILLFNKGAGAYEVWQYDPAATGFRDGDRTALGFPGAIVVSGDGPGFFQNRQGGSGPPASVTAIGENRILLLDPGGAYEIWQYDPTAAGFRDGARTASGFPGALVVSGTAPGFFDGGHFPGRSTPAAVSFLGFAPIDRQPGVIEQASIATDDNGQIQYDSKGNLTGAMYRWYASVSHGAAASVTRLKVEDLEVGFVGTNLVDASLLGYVEGPPPIPLENVPDGTGGLNAAANRVTLTVADDTENVWTWNRDRGIDFKADMEVGGTVGGALVKAKASIDTSYGWLDGREESATVSLVTVCESSLEGAAENGGWVPYNYGMAYLSGLNANIYALRLVGSERIIGYQQRVSSDQPEVQQLRFLINSRYTKQGTLDGMVGLQPDPDYPNAALDRDGNSYFKPEEAIAFAEAIQQEATQREAFYTQYNANAFNSLSDDDRAGMTQRSLIASCQWQAPGGLQLISQQVTNVSQTSAGGAFKFLGMVGESAEYSPPAGVPGATFKESAMFGGHLQLTVKKTQQATTSFGLSVSVAIRDDVVDSPPGTRVQRYDFQTFYLAEDSSHFHDFFGRVVDPVWLSGQKGDLSTVSVFLGALNRAKPVWRVLHRVTSVDRGENLQKTG